MDELDFCKASPKKAKGALIIRGKSQKMLLSAKSSKSDEGELMGFDPYPNDKLLISKSPVSGYLKESNF